MLDRYWTGSTARISPEAPVPVVNVGATEDRPGGAANVAINLATLGASVSLLGMTGDDENAKLLHEKLRAMQVDCHFEAVAGMDTITKLRIMSRNQQLLRLDFEKSFAQLSKLALLAKFKAHIERAKVVVLSDYNKGCLADPQPFIQLARSLNVPIIVDPKGNDFTRYRGASLITPNMSEFSAVVGDISSEQELAEKAQQLILDCDLNALLITRSEDGMSLFTREQDVMHLPAHAREVYDVTGAGDTVIATLAASIAAGESVKNACKLANYAASIVVAKLGTSTVSTTELALALNQKNQMEDSGVLNQEQLVQAVKQAQAAGEKVVMTNGCFDILHSGHVSYLTEAANLGQRLVVAVNSDASVRKLKGEGRPINNAKRRMAVLAALGAVDWVVEFDTDTPQALIARTLPDVLVKGGDYKIADIAGGAEVLANGGEVKVLSFEEGVSTSGIITQIVDAQ